MDLSPIEEELLDGRVKGLPGNVRPFPLRDIGAFRWCVADDDLPLPLLTLKRSAVEHNIALMQRYCEKHGVLLAPHGKTTMAPQLFRQQLEAGAWGMSAATVQQLHVYRRFGVPRVIFANQLVGPANIRFVCEELNRDPEFEIYPFVDSVESVQLLAAAARDFRLSRPLPVLAEVGYRGGRTGVRDIDTLDGVRQAIEDTGGRLELAGVAAFEGLLPVQRYEEGGARRVVAVTVEGFLESVARAVDHLLLREALPDGFIVTAGGSAAFDKVVEAFAGRWPNARVILRSGCYVTHDHGMYAGTSPLRSGREEDPTDREDSLRPALELWSYIQSRPEPNLALLTFGRRDGPFDYGLPIPLALAPAGTRERVPVKDFSITALNDQHAYLRIPSSAEIHVGDRVICGISHPCTAFDKWQVIPVVDEEGIVVDAVRTFF